MALASVETNTDQPPVGNKLYLVDGSGYIFRAFHALPPLTRKDGTPVNAVYGFCTMLQKLLDTSEDDAVAVIFDASGGSFRNEIYDDYKANRGEPPDELVPQFPLVREAARAFNLPVVEQRGFEADDLIATYARQAAESGIEVVIVSSDKDLMQLVRDGITMMDPMRNNAVIAAPEVEAKFGVSPDKVVDVQALAGDSVDNVPGVPGIGVKTAALLVNQFGDLESILDQAETIKQPKRRQSLIEFADQARVSRDLVVLKDDVPVDVPLTDLGRTRSDPAVLGAFLEEQGFRVIHERMKLRWFTEGLIDEHPAETAAAEKTDVSADYSAVSDMAALEAVLAEATESGLLGMAFFAADNDARPAAARLAGIALSPAPGRAYYVGIEHGVEDQGDLALSAPTATGLPPDRVFAALRQALEDPALIKVGHNIKPGLLTFWHEYTRHGDADARQAPRAVHDLMVMSFVLDGGRQSHKLEDLADRAFDHRTAELKPLLGSGRNRLRTNNLTVEQMLPVAAEAADYCRRLLSELQPRLIREGLTTVYETIERPLVTVLANMERAGVRVDGGRLQRLSKDFAGRIESLESKAHELAGESFNVGSPKQLGEILFGKLGMPGGRKSKTGAYSTGADILEDLAAAGHDLPRTVLDWRQLAKLKSTYTDALIGEVNSQTGRIHTSYSMTGAQTGRLSSNDPNLQNIPVRTEEGRKIREAFVAAPGCKLVSCDYSQIELRIVAHVARIEPLIEAFRNGADIHAMTASQVFGVPVEGMDPMMRRRAKAINFGIIYGISAFGLARNLGIPRNEAQDYIQAYLERYPGIRDYMSQTKLFAREKGYVETLFGRRIHLAAIKDRNPTHRAFAERQAINAPIQGSAADIIKRAMLRVPPVLQELSADSKMLLQVHDELLFEVPEADVDGVVAGVRTIMERAALPVLQLSVPLVVDAGVGDNWDQAH